MNQLLETTDERRTTDTRARGRGSRRHRSRLVAAIAAFIGAAVMIAAGASAAILSSNGEYVDLGGHGDYRTDGYALVTDGTDWRDTLLGFAGSVRVRVASADHEPIFVGVAAPDELRGYLAGVDSTTVHERDGSIVRTDHSAGSAPTVPAADAITWTAHAQGEATQTVQWRAAEGRQAVVAMHADGSRLVHVRVVSSAVTLDRMPWWVPVGALAFGGALLAIGAVVLRRTMRRPLTT